MRKNWKTLAVAGAAALLVMLLPLKKEVVEEHFVLEPMQRAVLRSEVPGRVVQVLVDEGQRVEAGASIVRLRDLGLESAVGKAAAEYRMATARATDAALRYADFASADQRRQEQATVYRMAREQDEKLDVRSPISGVVVTPRVHNLLDSYAVAGTEIAEIADLSSMRARVYVEEPEMRKLRTVTGNAVRVDSDWRPLRGQLIAISPTARELAPGLVPLPKYAGMRTAAYFTVDIVLPNGDGHLRDGMTGVARIYGRRRSFLGAMLQPAFDAVSRRFW